MIMSGRLFLWVALLLLVQIVFHPFIHHYHEGEAEFGTFTFFCCSQGRKALLVLLLAVVGAAADILKQEHILGTLNRDRGSRWVEADNYLRLALSQGILHPKLYS